MTRRPLRGLVFVVAAVALAACLPPRATGRATPTPDAVRSEPGSTPTEEPTFSYEPPVETFEPPVEESFPTFAVTKPEIRDRAFDWDNRMQPVYDAYDAATASSALRAAAHEILEGCMDQQRWLIEHTDFDPQYDEPMIMWRDAVNELCSGATNVVRGFDRGDTTLIRKGKRAVAAARATMSSTEFLGAWGPLLIH